MCLQDLGCFSSNLKLFLVLSFQLPMTTTSVRKLRKVLRSKYLEDPQQHGPLPSQAERYTHTHTHKVGQWVQMYIDATTTPNWGYLTQNCAEHFGQWKLITENCWPHFCPLLSCSLFSSMCVDTGGMQNSWRSVNISKWWTVTRHGVEKNGMFSLELGLCVCV